MSDLILRPDATFKRVVRAMVLPFVYKPIQGISNAAPAVISCAGHGVPDGWPIAIVSVQGMTDINTKLYAGQPKLSSFVKANAATVDTLSINSINSSEFPAYTTGGYVQYYTPMDLTSAHATLTIKDKPGGTALATLSDTSGEITIDNTAKTITIILPPVTIAAYTWSQGSYDLILATADSVKTLLLEGDISIVKD